MKELKIISLTLIAGFLMLSSTEIFPQSENKDIEWVSLEEAVSMAEENSKKIMLFMEADWCSLCKKMKAEIFPLSEIQQKIDSSFYAVRIDIESNDDVNYKSQKWTKKELSQEFGLYATPTFIFLESDQSIIGNKAGYMDQDEFIKLLSYISDEKYLEGDFENFQNN
ncbi:thioredoxin family protein [Gracilimonas sp.]|uniref:thioredoxin family protein n=1 Tax=Gracilimonas sp. TaxID=1974203 RepID=UPI0028714851|nr:thioredoxin fold domain-containing protein [Gracilimonas sp.]